VLDRADPNLTGQWDATLLHYIAASRGDIGADDRLALATMVLDAGGRLDLRDSLLKSTPLGWACRWGRAELLSLFLERGADPIDMLRAVGKRGVTRLLVEGGATLAAVLLRAGLIDRIAWFRSGGVIGGDGIPAVEAYGVDRLNAIAQFERRGVMRLGADLLETLARRY
jgi:riboflavin biosynthesis pyrimidine reductase